MPAAERHARIKAAQAAKAASSPQQWSPSREDLWATSPPVCGPTRMAILLPAQPPGAMASSTGFVRPVQRGSGPRKAFRDTASVWPHRPTWAVDMDEVSLDYRSYTRQRRVLVSASPSKQPLDRRGGSKLGSPDGPSGLPAEGLLARSSSAGALLSSPSPGEKRESRARRVLGRPLGAALGGALGGADAAPPPRPADEEGGAAPSTPPSRGGAQSGPSQSQVTLPPVARGRARGTEAPNASQELKSPARTLSESPRTSQSPGPEIDARSPRSPQASPRIVWCDTLVTRMSFNEPPTRPPVYQAPPPPASCLTAPPLENPLRGRARSNALMGTLFDLRRGGHSPERKTEPDSPKDRHSGLPKNPHPPTRDECVNQEEEVTLLDATLMSLNDTPQELEEKIATMKGLQAPAGDYGGSRHPTTCVSHRTLKILERKLVLLSTLLQKTAGFARVCDAREKVVERLVGGATPEDVAGSAMGFMQTVRDSIHPKVDPVDDENRCNFESFSATFKMCKDHQDIKRAQSLFAANEEVWATKVLEVAKREAEKERESEHFQKALDMKSPCSEAAIRLVRFAEGIGVAQDNRSLLQAELVAKAAKGMALERCTLNDFKKQPQDHRFQKTLEAVGRCEKNLSEAVEWGLQPNHPCIHNAKRHACEYWEQALLRYATHEQGKSRTRLGEAIKAAEEIDNYIRAATKFGCDHKSEAMTQVQGLSRKCREEEGIRKRQAARAAAAAAS